MTNARNITDTQINKLRREAYESGDLAMEAACARALGDPTTTQALVALAGWFYRNCPGVTVGEMHLSVEEARAECARVITDAQAQEPEAE